MAKWIDTRSTQGELLYSVRECLRYSVWPEGRRWVAKHHPNGNPIFGQAVVIGRAGGCSAARMLCRDHLDSTNAASAAGQP